MSVALDDFARDVITTKNGKHVMIDTRFVSWPLGRGYETSVSRCSTNGKVSNPIPLEVQGWADKESADIGHGMLINRWMKEVLK